MSAILIDYQDEIVTLTINREKALNAINEEIMTGLNSFFSEGYRELDKIDGVIITGAGEKAFAAGADIKEFSSLDQVSGTAKTKYGQATYFLIERFHRPVIAAVNGFALGGGCELAMACHMRIASENARFGQPEVNLGLIPGYGGTQRLAQLIGKAKALELLLTANMIDAKEALRLGLVNHVVEIEGLIEMCRSMIKKIGTKGPIAIAKSIEALNALYDETQNGYEVEAGMFGKLLAGDECKEGVEAFVEKRKPNF